MRRGTRSVLPQLVQEPRALAPAGASDIGPLRTLERNLLHIREFVARLRAGTDVAILDS
jgi:hypothetical protein